jgi:hypothetical protein
VTGAIAPRWTVGLVNCHRFSSQAAFRAGQANGGGFFLRAGLMSGQMLVLFELPLDTVLF